MNLSKKLETIKYVHIHDLLIKQCNIPYDVAHCIIGYVFIVLHADNLEGLKHKWDVIVLPSQK